DLLIYSSSTLTFLVSFPVTTVCSSPQIPLKLGPTSFVPSMVWQAKHPMFCIIFFPVAPGDSSVATAAILVVSVMKDLKSLSSITLTLEYIYECCNPQYSAQ